jgi:hypothetical protein
MKRNVQRRRDEMRPEYELDYSKAVRGKYYRRLLAEGSNVVVLDPDVAARFRTSAAVNEALRKLLQTRRATPAGERARPKRRPRPASGRPAGRR